jgi:hypothetical protein
MTHLLLVPLKVLSISVLLDETDGWQRKPDLPLYTPVIATFTF